MAWKKEIARLEFLLNTEKEKSKDLLIENEALNNMIEKQTKIINEANGELSNANATITKQEEEIAVLKAQTDIESFYNFSKDAHYNNFNEIFGCWKQKQEKMIYGEDLYD